MHKPATPLPWFFEAHGLYGQPPFEEGGEPWPFGYISHGPNTPSPVFEITPIFDADHHSNADYIVEACNAYPKLFEALRSIIDAYQAHTNDGADEQTVFDQIIKAQSIIGGGHGES